MSVLLERLRALLEGRYRVERELGHGGMATVYLGEDLKHRRRVAIKVLDPELAALLGADRFAREIEFAAALQHPHILTLLDSGAGDGLLFYVMPFVEGESLRARIDQERRLGVDETARFGIEVARALDYAHRQGIVHRDIKPENVLLADRQAVVADFGIARAIRAAGGDSITRTGLTLGTPQYMSPEQVAGSGEIDGRSDVYSLGCVLYEMLAGQPPFTGPAETLGHQHLNVAPRPLAELRPGVPVPLAAAIDRALAKAPADRFSTAGQFADALASATHPTMAAASPEAATRGSPRRRPALVIATVVVAAVGTLVAWRLGALDVLLPHRTAEAGEREWVWLTPFEGPADDPSLAVAARDLVGSALDESGVLAAVPPEQVRIALRAAGRPDTTRVDEALARQLAYRSAIAVVVGGRVNRIGSGFSVALRAVDAENGRVLLAPAGTAADEKRLIPELTRLARELRAGLAGRKRPRHPRPTFDAPTPSFEAYKLYVKGRTAILDFDPISAVPLLRQAIALDPEFASAWTALGTAFGNEALRDSALAAHREALRHPDRLPEVRRYDALAKIAQFEGRPQDAIAAYDAMLALDPPPVDAATALHNKALTLSAMGHCPEALALYRRAAALWPIEAPLINRLNIVGMLIALDSLDEARAEMPAGTSIGVMILETQLAFQRRQWERGDSLGLILASTSQGGTLPQLIGSFGRASAAAARGELARARGILTESTRTAAETWADGAMGIWIYHGFMDVMTGIEPPVVPEYLPPRQAQLLGAFRAAWLGDSTRARRLPPSGGVDPELAAVIADQLQGWLDHRRGRWTQVIERLGPDASVGYYDPGSMREALRNESRWIVADAFLRSGHPDSAAFYLGLMLDPPGRAPHVIVSRGLVEPFARRRLVEVLAQAGRLDEARRQWEILSETVTHPDPELVAAMDETRALLQSAGAMRAASRR